MSAVPCWASKRASGRTVTRFLHIDTSLYADLRVHLLCNSSHLPVVQVEQSDASLMKEGQCRSSVLYLIIPLMCVVVIKPVIIIKVLQTCVHVMPQQSSASITIIGINI